MKDFLKKIVSAIVSEGSKFEIREEQNLGASLYIIIVPEEEIGKVIGKEGKVINAIRILCRLKAGKEAKRILIKVDVYGKGFSLPTDSVGSPAASPV